MRLTLAEALTRLPGTVESGSVKALGASSEHDVYRLVIAGEEALLRICDRDALSLPALAVQRGAAAAGLAPEVLLAAPDAGLLLSRFVTGEPHDRASLATVARAVGRLLRTLHAQPVCGVRLDLAGAARGYAEHCPAGLVTQTAAALDILLSGLDAIPERTFVPCHNDPVAANFIRGAPLTLIDWEFAADNDPLFDLAVVSAHHDFDSAARNALLAGYEAERDEQDVAALTLWETIYRALYWLWLAARPPEDESQARLAALATRLTLPGC